MTQEQLQKALVHMENALRLLDDTDAPADIGAHLDLAIWRLKHVIFSDASKLGDAGTRSLPSS